MADIADENAIYENVDHEEEVHSSVEDDVPFHVDSDEDDENGEEEEEEEDDEEEDEEDGEEDEEEEENDDDDLDSMMEDLDIQEKAEYAGGFFNKCKKVAVNHYLFKKDDIYGMYNPELYLYINKNEATKYFEKGEDWVHKKVQDGLPSTQIGSYFFVVSKDVIALAENKRAYLQDWLYPWDRPSRAKTGKGNVTRWSKEKQANGTIFRWCRSKHYRKRHMLRQIMFYTDEDSNPVSHILYQYIVLQDDDPYVDPFFQKEIPEGVQIFYERDLQQQFPNDDPFYIRPRNEDVYVVHSNFNAKLHRELMKELGPDGNVLPEYVLHKLEVEQPEEDEKRKEERRRLREIRKTQKEQWKPREMEMFRYGVPEGSDKEDEEEDEQKMEEEDLQNMENAPVQDKLVNSKQNIVNAMGKVKKLLFEKIRPVEIEFYTNNVLLLAQLNQTMAKEMDELVYAYHLKLEEIKGKECEEIYEEPPQKKNNIEVIDFENSPNKMVAIKQEPIDDYE